MISEKSSNYNFKSRYGGMWIDRNDFRETLELKIKMGEIPAYLEQIILEFETNGFIVLKNAVMSKEMDAFEYAISKAYRDGHEKLIAQNPGSILPVQVTPQIERRNTRIVDAFAVLREALDILSAPRLIEFLSVIFGEPPLLMQSISFDMGSEQGMHQDTAYVVVNRPMELLACWIALEDVCEGSGELEYLVGSHRLGDFDFSGDRSRKHWVRQKDGDKKHEEWYNWIISESSRRGFHKERFLAKRGDILVWHADLAHGGARIKNPEQTRKSLVGHYCASSAIPHFMSIDEQKRERKLHGSMYYSSYYYDLRIDQSQSLHTQESSYATKKSSWRRPASK